jgi:hypothetical protein
MPSEDDDIATLLHAIAICNRLIEGEMSFICGIRDLCDLIHQTGILSDFDMTTLGAIDSETEALPIGPLGKLWDKTALEKLKFEIAAAEQWAKVNGLEECAKLRSFAVARLEGLQV